GVAQGAPPWCRQQRCKPPCSSSTRPRFVSLRFCVPSLGPARRWCVSQQVPSIRSTSRSALAYDTAGGATLDASFEAVSRFGHVVSSLGWGRHALGPLSFKGATYSGVFTLLPLLTGEGRAHHADILAQATRLVEAGALVRVASPSLQSK